jgi:hypothetical protein
MLRYAFIFFSFEFSAKRPKMAASEPTEQPSSTTKYDTFPFNTMPLMLLIHFWYQSPSTVDGIVIALCCHQLCDWDRYCNPVRFS